MRHLTLLMAMAFALGAVSVAQAACPGMETASTQTNIASADQTTPSSTKITIPAPKIDG